MKKIISISLALVSACVLTAASFSAFADTPAAGTGNAGPGNNANGGPQGGGMDAKDFPARKAEILQRISEHLAKVQQAQSCVQAANDLEALRACRPHGDNGNQGGGQRPGGQRPDGQ